METSNFERNERMFKSVILGNTWAATAKAEGISRERVRQVVYKMCRMMSSPKRLGADVMPTGDYFDVQELRKHADFWLSQLEKLKEESKTV